MLHSAVQLVAQPAWHVVTAFDAVHLSMQSLGEQKRSLVGSVSSFAPDGSVAIVVN